MLRESFERKITQETLSVLRVVFFDEFDNVDLLTRHKEQYQNNGYIPPISNRNELKVLNEMIKMIQLKLAEYPRTLEGDVDQFKREDLTTNNRNALHITLGEKQILLELVESLKGLMDLMLGTKEEFNKLIPDPDELMQAVFNVIE